MMVVATWRRWKQHTKITLKNAPKKSTFFAEDHRELITAIKHEGALTSLVFTADSYHHEIDDAGKKTDLNNCRMCVRDNSG